MAYVIPLPASQGLFHHGEAPSTPVTVPTRGSNEQYLGRGFCRFPHWLEADISGAGKAAAGVTERRETNLWVGEKIDIERILFINSLKFINF